MKLSWLQPPDIVRAAREIDRTGIPRQRVSRGFDVIIGGKAYPPKYVITLAIRLAGRREPGATAFITTHARGILTSRGFTVRRKNEALKPTRKPPLIDAILLTWRDPGADGSTDILPLEWFANPPIHPVAHNVRGPRGGLSQAKCVVRLSEYAAELDYEPFERFNEPRGMELGIARLTFSDADRTAICKAEWKANDVDDFTDCKFDSPRYQSAPSPPYVPPTQFAPKVSRDVRERPGQRKFCTRLRGSYENKCCITGCTVAEALEAAHIDAYVNKDSHNPKNGLLLRRDIHALFDAYLLSVEPRSLKIRTAAAVQSCPNYKHLAGGVLRPPHEPSHAPDRSAITRHWIEFLKRNKSERARRVML